jgi:putative heme-binding domain-containing protein
VRLGSEFYKELAIASRVQSLSQIGCRMDERHKASHLVSFAIFSCLTLSRMAFAQAIPDGKGEAEFRRICSNCHAVTVATRLNNSEEGWKSVVNEMVSRGAQGSQADLDNVTLYLSTNFGLGNSSPAPLTPASLPTPAQSIPIVMLSSPLISNAKRVVAQNTCAACHRIGGEGSYVGPSLDDVGARHKPDEIRAAILSPQSKVQPENRQVRLTQHDGRTVVGKILNQDGYSVQLVDATGQLATYTKSGLLEFTIVDANPMPSFANKITGQDLDELVRYLSSLTEPGK